MANQSNESISLEVANGVNNVFIGLWKSKITTSNSIMYSCVPFTRNLIEYIKSEKHEDYLALTKLLHWKEGSDQFTEGQFYALYNRTFGTEHDETSPQKMIDILLSTANEIADSKEVEGLNLQDKVLMSIAIRVLAERYITDKLRTKKSDPSYWSVQKAYGKLLSNEFEPAFPSDPSLPVLKKVSVTVCSNIHLNSFMYEPILDLTIEHLIYLYKEVRQLT
ncbi:hypothetical protein [Vibrio vulnificus]|uniref:hypothetical protein n=2 Tax=Vibrionaceae TaxID=641 RepID=UPI001A913C34|nr:hypothetical protein [Vibrio vulnificus]